VRALWTPGIGLAALAAAVWSGPTALPGGAAQASEWLTGDALRTKLAQPETVFWQDAPLRETLEKFCRAQGVAIFIDRRVDPGQKLDGGVGGVPVGGILQQIAESRNLGLCFFGPVAYLGPPEFTARLRTLAEMRREDVRRLSAGGGQKFAKSEAAKWDDFATPRQLLDRLADQNGIEIGRMDQVPHDLWAAADLPPLPLVDRLTLIAGQFDLTFTISSNGREVTLVPLPEEVAIVRDYPAGRNAQELVGRWQALAPDAQFKIAGTKIYVKGRLEDHEQIKAARQPEARPGESTPRLPTGGERRFTGRVVNKPLGEVLRYVAAQLDLNLEIDRAGLVRAGVSLDQLVSFSVKDAGVDELFHAVLDPVGCTFRRRGKTVEIVPAE